MSILEKHPFEMIVDGRQPAGLGGRWYGVYIGLVRNIQDPEGQGRVKVSLPWSPDTGNGSYETWARLATLMGGKNRGSWFIPDVDDEVLIIFEGGDPRRPYVIGGLWNGRDTPPEQMDGGGRNFRKVLRSRNGVKITLDDQDGQEQMILETPGGQRITLKDGPGSVQITDSNGNFVNLETNGITVNAAARISITAGGPVELSAPTVTVNAPMSVFNGTVRAQTVLCDTIVSAVYTPGAGNIW